MKEVKIGIIGFGTVGAGVAETILKNGEVIARRTGIKLVLSGIADIDTATDRGVKINPGILSDDYRKLVGKVDVVVETVGGTTTAKDIIMDALRRGKPVVTANKALLAEAGEELFATAESCEADIYYEASVAGGIPVIKALREGLVANRIESIYGIMNGTCNYILTRMESDEVDFATVLAEAQQLGYAEREPSLDIDGHDTAHKAAILASLAYGRWFGVKPVHVEGIRDISLIDIKFATELGYRIKLLAVIKQVDDDVQIRVHPTLVPEASMLGNINGVFNGVMIDGDTVGKTLFYGRGAGRAATASAVVADLVDVGLNLKFGSHRRVPAFRIGPQYRKLLDMNDISTRYYLRMQVKDHPGVIAAVAKILADKKISISSFIQREAQELNDTFDNVPLLILTHEAREKQMKTAIAELERLDFVCDNIKLFRIEDL